MKASGLRVLILVIASSVLVFGFATHSASASVPGLNEGVDVSTTGGSPNGSSGLPTMSEDGRYIAFESSATDLVSSPTVNGNAQVYVRDRLNNTTQLVSVSSSGSADNGYAQNPQISANGRYVVFNSNATNLVSGVTDGVLHVYIHDMNTGTTSIVDTSASGSAANNASQLPSVSADGQFVVFNSYANNLVSSPTLSGGGGTQYIYLKNMSTGTVQLVSMGLSSTAPNGASQAGGGDGSSISCEGRYVVFYSSATNLTSDEPSTVSDDVFVADMLSGTTTDITLNENGESGTPSISCDGSYVAFGSTSTNLVSGLTVSNGYGNAYVYDMINGTTDLVSQATDGTQGNATSWSPTVSDDGRYVAFNSYATNLTSGVTGSNNHVYLRDRQSGTTELLDVNSSGTVGNGDEEGPAISADGRYAIYSSQSTNLVSGFSNTNGVTIVSQTGTSATY